jgi:hypothetical protein
MKRDMDLIREILRKIEEHPARMNGPRSTSPDMIRKKSAITSACSLTRGLSTRKSIHQVRDQLISHEG